MQEIENAKVSADADGLWAYGGNASSVVVVVVDSVYDYASIIY